MQLVISGTSNHRGIGPREVVVGGVWKPDNIRMHMVYMLDWSEKGGPCYIGQTKDLPRRLSEHFYCEQRNELLRNAFEEYKEPEVQVLHWGLTRAEARKLEQEEAAKRSAVY